MKKSVLIFAMLLIIFGSAFSFVKGQANSYGFNFDTFDLNSYVAGSVEIWYYNTSTSKCVKGKPATLSTKTYTTEKDCKDAQTSGAFKWNPILPNASTSTPSSGIGGLQGIQVSTPAGKNDYPAVSGLGVFSSLPSAGVFGGTATSTPASGAGNFFDKGSFKMFGVPEKDNSFTKPSTVSESAKPSFFTSILQDLGFVKKIDTSKEPKSQGDAGNNFLLDSTGGLVTPEIAKSILPLYQPEAEQPKGFFDLLFDGIKEGLTFPKKDDAVILGGEGEGGTSCGETQEAVEKSIQNAITKNDIEKIKTCVKEWKWPDRFVHLEITSINEATAEALASGSIQYLYFESLTSINEATAEALASGSIQYLYFESLTSINEATETATALASGSIRELFFYSLTSINEATAKALTSGSIKQLGFFDLTLINEATAKALASGSIKHLYLDCLTSINEATAKALASESIKHLYLSGLTSINEATAKALASESINYLNLYSITSINEAIAKALTSESINSLTLYSITSINEATAEVFANFIIKGGRIDTNDSVQKIIDEVKNKIIKKIENECKVNEVKLYQEKDEIARTNDVYLINLDKELDVKITLKCKEGTKIQPKSWLKAYFGSGISDGKTKTFSEETSEFIHTLTFTSSELQAQKNIIKSPGVLNVKFYDFVTKEESYQTRPIGILFEEKTEQKLKLCYKIEGKEEKCLEGKNSNFGHIKTSKDKPIEFNWETKGFDLCWLANPKDLRVELKGSRLMDTRQSDFENFGITCQYTKIDRKEIHQTLMFQIESELKTDDKFDFNIKGNNKDINCQGAAEFTWDIGKNWTKCEKIEPTDKTYFNSKNWDIKAGEKGNITIDLKENKSDSPQNLIFGIKCYKGDKDTTGEERKIQVNLSKCETPASNKSANCINETSEKPKACNFSAVVDKRVVLKSLNNPGNGAFRGRFDISECAWPTADQPIYLRANIYIDANAIALPQTGKQINSSLNREWEVKFSDIYKKGQENILGTLWDDNGNPKQINGKVISGAPVNFTIKVDQCIDEKCTQTCSHNEKGDVIQVVYVRKEALPKDTRPKTNTSQEIFTLGVSKVEVELEEQYKYTFTGDLPKEAEEVKCSLIRTQTVEVPNKEWTEVDFNKIKTGLPKATWRYTNSSDTGKWWLQVRCKDKNGNKYYSNTVEINVIEKDAGIQKPAGQTAKVKFVNSQKLWFRIYDYKLQKYEDKYAGSSGGDIDLIQGRDYAFVFKPQGKFLLFFKDGQNIDDVKPWGPDDMAYFMFTTTNQEKQSNLTFETRHFPFACSNVEWGLGESVNIKKGEIEIEQGGSLRLELDLKPTSLSHYNAYTRNQQLDELGITIKIQPFMKKWSWGRERWTEVDWWDITKSSGRKNVLVTMWMESPHTKSESGRCGYKLFEVIIVNVKKK